MHPEFSKSKKGVSSIRCIKKMFLLLKCTIFVFSLVEYGRLNHIILLHRLVVVLMMFKQENWGSKILMSI